MGSLPSPEYIAGPVIHVHIFNSDTVPIYLRFGPSHSVWLDDTINLAKVYSCTDDSKKPYYDLDYLKSEEDNCIRWFSPQILNPGDTAEITCRLTDHNLNDSTRLYIGYTAKMPAPVQDTLRLNKNVLILMRGPNEFKWLQINIPGNAPDKEIYAKLAGNMNPEN